MTFRALVIIGLLFFGCFADEPVIITTETDEYGKAVVLLDVVPVTLDCQLQDFMPQQAEMSYMINFCSPIEIKKDLIDPNGNFKLSKTENAWFIEGVNTFTIVSRNRLGMSNRQTTIFQIFTTGPRVEVNWPPVNTLLKQKNPKIRATARLIYDGGLTTFIRDNFTLCINKINLKKPENGLTFETTSSVALPPESIGVTQKSLDSLKAFEPDLKKTRIPGSVVFSCTPPWNLVPKNETDADLYTIELEVSSFSKDALDKTKSYKSSWTLERDDVNPTIKIKGNNSASPLLDSLFYYQFELSDNKSTILKDVRTKLYRKNGDKWEDVNNDSYNNILPFVSCGSHSSVIPLRKPKPGFFDWLMSFFSSTSNLLQDGTYKLEIRARDQAILDETHYRIESELENAYKEKNNDKIKELYKTYYEKHYASSSDENFNYAIGFLIFTIDITPPEIKSVSVSPTTLTSTTNETKLGVTYNLSEKSQVMHRVLLDKKISETQQASVEMFREIVAQEAGESKAFHLDFSRFPTLLPDGNYHFELSATDEAGNPSDTVKSKPFTIDKTGPIIQDFIIPKLVIGDKEDTIPSNESAVTGKASALKLKIKTFDLFMGETLAVNTDKISLSIQQPTNKSDIMLTNSNISLEKVPDTKYEFSAIIPTNLFPEDKGKYYIKAEISDNRTASNKSTAYEPVVKGCIPPEISSPLKFSEVAGTVVLKGIAKDPNWSDGVRFACYELEYRKVNFDKTGNLIPESNDWEIDGLTVPASYRTGHYPSFNVSEVPVSDNSVLGYWNTRSGKTSKQGYYQVRLLVYDKTYHPEFSQNPLDEASNADSWAADTSIFYVYNDTALSLSGDPKIKITTPLGNSYKMDGKNSIPFGFTLTDNSDKKHDVTLEIRDKSGRVVADTVYKSLSGNNTAQGNPGNFSRLGYFIFQENDVWHVKWNNAGSERRFKGFIRFNGKIQNTSSNSCAKIIQESDTDSGISAISFDTSASSEFTFKTSARQIDFDISMTPGVNQAWIFAGKDRKQINTSMFTLYGSCSPKPYLYNGKNKFNFFPAPGNFTFAINACGLNGIGAAEDSRKVYLDFPFGIEIEGISDTLFEMDTSTFYKELSIYYRPVSESYISCFLLDDQNNSYPIFKDSLKLGRSTNAEPYSYTWNFNINTNELIKDGKYRFLMKAAPDKSNESQAAYDTSATFRFAKIKTLKDETIASLDIKGDTNIFHNGVYVPAVNGKSDYTFMAKGKGKSYADIPFTYTSTLAGKQSVIPHGFDRFTIKARRGFKTITYKVRIWLESSCFYRSTRGQRRGPVSANNSYNWGTTDYFNDNDPSDYFSTNNNANGQLSKLKYTDTYNGINSHYFNFSVTTPSEWGRDPSIFNRKGQPKLHIYFLPNSFNGTENHNNWQEFAWETLTLDFDQTSDATTHYALTPENIWGRIIKKDTILFTQKEYDILKTSVDSFFPVEKSNYSQFMVQILGRRRWENSEKCFFGLSYDIKFGIRPQIWDNNYTRHGFNNLVNRYTTWDSDNSVFYNRGKGLIAKDGMDNNFDKLIDTNKLYSIATASANAVEDDIKFIGDMYPQAFDFNILKKSGFSYTPFLFSGLEEGDTPTPSLSEPFWEFKLCGVPDNGKYTEYSWAKCFDDKKDPNLKSDYSVINMTPTKERPEVKIHIDGDHGPRGIMVWCKGMPTGTSRQAFIEWPISPNRLDTVNLTTPELLKQNPPGFSADQLYIPHFGGNVRYGITDGLDNDHNGFIDPEYTNLSPDAIPAMDERMGKSEVNQSLTDSGLITLKPDGQYTYETVINKDIRRFGANVSPYPRIEKIDSPIPLINKEVNGDTGIIKVVFTPIENGYNWTTLDDPMLKRSNTDFLDSIDNNRNLRIDEDVPGYLISDPVAFNQNGFATLNQRKFVDGYDKLSASTQNGDFINQTFYYRTGEFHDNDKTTVDDWDISLRHINGEPNKDLIISSISAKQPTQTQNDLLDYFTVRLKDNVFVPRKFVEISGMAIGSSYKLLARNGSGWRKIEPVVKDSIINSQANKRVLAYWDISDLNGGNTLLLQVKNNGQTYQAMQNLYVGQYASGSEQSMYSTHSRSRLDLPENALKNWGDTGFVSITARKLDDLKLTKLPSITPVGPIMELKPSPVSFTADKRPKLTVNFTYNEAKYNGWLEKNFNFYVLNGDGILDIVENSVSSYFKTDSFGSRSNPLNDKNAFIYYGDSTRGQALMQIAAETDHWSDFAIINRPPRTLFVDAAAPPFGNGKNWKTAFNIIDTAVAHSYSGDTIKIAKGDFTINNPVKKNINIMGGFDPKKGVFAPSKNQTRLANSILLKTTTTVIGVVFLKSINMDSCIVSFRRCAFKNAIVLKQSKAWFIHSTFDNTNISGLKTDTLFFYNSILKNINSSNISTIAPESQSCFSINDNGNDLNPDLTLKRTSKLIDVCSSILDNLHVFGLAPDPGFDEFQGDTFYVSANKGTDNNSGKKAEQPFKSITKGVNVAQSHDAIFIAQGNYKEGFVKTTGQYIYGGFNDSFNKRNLHNTITRLIGKMEAIQPGLISGIYFIGKEGTGLSVNNGQYLIDSCRFTGFVNGIGSDSKNTINISHTIFDSNKTALACPPSCSLTIINNTFVNNMLSVAPKLDDKILLRNNLFYQNKIDIPPIQNAISFENNLTYKSTVSIPLTGKSNICFDPKMIDPDNANYWLTPYSPCLYKGVNNGLIGALGRESGLRMEKMITFAVNGHGQLSQMEPELLKLSPNTINKTNIATGDADANFKCILFSGYTDDAIYFLIKSNRPKPSADTMGLFFATPLDTGKAMALFISGNGNVLTDNITNTAATNINGSIIVKIPLAGMHINPLRDNDHLLFDFIYLTSGENPRCYSFNGSSAKNKRAYQLGMLIARDNLTPVIKISNIKRYSSNIVKPIVNFLHTIPGDSTILQVNNNPAIAGQEFYLEGNYHLKAAIIRAGKCIADTTARFSIDMTEPELKITELPPNNPDNWNYSIAMVPETKAKFIKPVILASDKYLRYVRAELNGRPYNLNGEQIDHQGMYALRAVAEDSAGNITDKDILFRIVRPSNELKITILSPATLEDSTHALLDTIKGYVNSNAVKIFINNDSVKSTKSFKDSTVFTYPVVLIKINNTFGIAAKSKISNAKDSITISISRDTILPAITITSPLSNQRFESSVSIWEIPVTGKVISKGSLRSLNVKSPFYSVNALTTKADDTTYNFATNVMVQGENRNYPITVSTENIYGNKATKYVVTAIGTKPSIINRTPAPFSTLNTSTAILKGIVYEPNLRTVFIQFSETQWTKMGDSSTYEDTVNLPNLGPNTITIRAEDSLGFADSISIVLFRDNIPPVFTITSPLSGLVTGQDHITIIGNIDDPFAYVFTGKDTALYPTGTNFQIKNHLLQPGINTIIVSARDTAKNFAIPETLMVTFIDSSVIYVDSSYNGIEDGSSAKPFRTLLSGVNASKINGTLIIRKGTYNESAAFKTGQKVQGGGGRVLLNCGQNAFTTNGDITLSNLNLMSTGTDLFLFNGGKNLTITTCTLFISLKGLNISGYNSVSIDEMLVKKTKSTPVISISNCKALNITHSRFDDCDSNLLIISNTSNYSIKNCLFTDILGYPISAANSNGTITYCTFSTANAPADLDLSGGSAIIKNNIFNHVSGFVVIRRNNVIIDAGYNDYWGFVLGIANDSIGFNSATSRMVDPKFAEDTLFTLQDVSSLKHADENGMEIGRYGTSMLGKKEGIRILSPFPGVTVSGTINIITNTSRFKGDYTIPELIIDGKAIQAPLPQEPLPDNVWGQINTTRLSQGLAKIRIGGTYFDINLSSPKLLSQIPFTDPIGISFRNNSTIDVSSKNGEIKSYDLSGSELIKMGGLQKTIQNKATTGNNGLSLVLDGNNVTCKDPYQNNLFSFGGLGKSDYTFDSPNAIAVSDSTFAISDSGNKRIMVYAIYSKAADMNSKYKDSDESPISIRDLHFIPSPFKSRKEKGYIRYFLNRSADVEIVIYDRLGRHVNSFHFSSHEKGGKSGINEIEWNGKNGRGSFVTSGVYIFSITAKAVGKSLKSDIKMSVIASE